MDSRFILAGTQPYNLYVNSKNRSNLNQPTTLFNIKLAFPPFHVSRITLLWAIIPNTLYTFRNDQFVVNNNFDFIDSSGLQKTAIIPPGTYNISQFITTFTNALMAVSPDIYTVTYNPNTFQLTIMSSSALFRILGATGTHIGHNILYFIGFNNVDTIAGTTQVAPNALNLDFPREIFIKIGQFVAPIHDSSNQFVCMFQVSINSPPGGLVFYENFDRHESGLNVETRSLNALDIQMVDEDGHQVLLNTDWSFGLMFE